MAAKSSGKVNFVKSCQYTLDTPGVENFDKIALSRTVKEIEANLCVFHFLAKIQNSLHFWGEENFLKIAKSTLLRYPVGRKFQRNRSISHGLGDIHIYVFLLCSYYSITQEVKDITINNNTKQAIDAINLHTKFYKDDLNMFPLKRVKTEMQFRVGSK